MTPSLGEGGSCALESAVALLASLPPGSADDDSPGYAPYPNPNPSQNSNLLQCLLLSNPSP